MDYFVWVCIAFFAGYLVGHEQHGKELRARLKRLGIKLHIPV